MSIVPVIIKDSVMVVEINATSSAISFHLFLLKTFIGRSPAVYTLVSRSFQQRKIGFPTQVPL
jgi:hypothetical protein